MKPLILAGVQSSVGKTTVTTALMKVFTNKGMRVAPFKVGPDYIDPKFHSFVTGAASYNLDSWMLNEDTVRYLYNKNSSNADIAIIEGVMGLYDGLGTETVGSTAHVAKILEAPVILVIDAKGMSSSIAALISGYVNYDKAVNLVGVILNNISGESHYSLLKKIIEKNTSVECLGYMPLNSDCSFADRHLGLIPVEELKDLDRKIAVLADSAESCINVQRIKEIVQGETQYNNGEYSFTVNKSGKGMKLAVAKDEAFNFYYHDNLNLLKECGIELVEFSPLRDPALPTGVDAAYIGGGFPEVFAKELSENVSLRKDINQKANNNFPIYAECGGLMYLTGGIINRDSECYPMVDFFKCKARMTGKLQRFGYIEIQYDGISTRGHEFHHTTLDEITDTGFEYRYSIKKAGKNKEWQCGLSKKNVLAAYPHIHFYSNIQFFEKILELFKSVDPRGRVLI
ncbi:MAG: cobyrinate a,c-diamide synthase [bacterium]|nr:cobyrinate a,c-diamide synthase [bacterium]